MKKLLICALIAVISGCSSTITLQNVETPANFVNQICPLIPLINENIEAFPGISPQVAINISAAKPFLDAVCSPGAVPSIGNINDLAKAGFPLLIEAVNLAPPLTPILAEIKAGIFIAQDIAAIINANQPIATK